MNRRSASHSQILSKQNSDIKSIDIQEVVAGEIKEHKEKRKSTPRAGASPMKLYALPKDTSRLENLRMAENMLMLS